MSDPVVDAGANGADLAGATLPDDSFNPVAGSVAVTSAKALAFETFNGATFRVQACLRGHLRKATDVACSNS